MNRKVRNEERLINFIFIGGAFGIIGMIIGALISASTSFSIAIPLGLLVIFWLFFGGLVAYYTQEINDWLIK